MSRSEQVRQQALQEMSKRTDNSIDELIELAIDGYLFAHGYLENPTLLPIGGFAEVHLPLKYMGGKNPDRTMGVNYAKK